MGIGSLLHKAKKLTVRTRVLEIAYEQWGSLDGFPIVLLHGFPDDVRAWDDVAIPLSEEGYRVLVPYLRGFGPTRFLEEATPRVGQQAAIGQDVIGFMDELGIESAVLSGYDWGNRAACVASILNPERVRALLSIHGYGINDTNTPSRPPSAAEERECWYHWYFNIERGRVGLEINRRDICRLLWESWSPGWKFEEPAFQQTAQSFDNPDFVDVVVQEYRHAHGSIPGDPYYAATERLLATFPPITVPSMVLHGHEDTVHPVYRSRHHMHLFPEGTERIIISGAGHFVPRECPDAVVEALVKLLSQTV